MRTTTRALAIGLALATSPAFANDSTAELGIGGLTLTKSADIVMQSEDLFISEQLVTVDYVFLNTSTQDIVTVVAFPLPDVTNDFEAPAYDYEGELGFKTTIDGQPAELTLVQQAIHGGKDVTERLRAAKVPLMPIFPKFDTALKALPPETVQALVGEGLIESDGGSDPSWTAHWITKTTVTRSQTFPAGRAVAVSHAYKPFVGGSVGSLLKPSLRSMPDMRKEVTAYRAKYCVDDGFVRAFDAARGKLVDTLQPDVWISYVLTSGANWKGPIGRFRLVVDKGDPRNLVSFCATGVKKIAPTRFEVVYKDFTPKQNVDVLIVRPPATD